jgi:hypothetical protein
MCIVRLLAAKKTTTLTVAVYLASYCRIDQSRPVARPCIIN